MSRTYRKTKAKSSAPKWSQTHFSQQQLNMQDIPLPPRVQLKYETITEKVMVYGSITAPQDPKDPRWCTKGTPQAIAEWVNILKQYTGIDGRIVSWYRSVESGRYFLPTQDKTVEKTRRRLVRTPIDWLSTSWRDQWDHERVWNHVHINASGQSRKRSTNRFNKREGVRRLRREGSQQVRHWQDEYHLNEHLLPYNWVLDGDDYFDNFFEDDMDDWEDVYDAWAGYTSTECPDCGRSFSSCHCDDSYGYEDFEDWDRFDDMCFYDDANAGSHYDFDKRHEDSIDISVDSGRSLGDILEDIRKEQEKNI